MNILEVWSIASVLAALAGGAAVGYVIGGLSDSNRFGSRSAARGTLACWVGALAMFTGAVFYAGQTVDAALTGDPHLDRIVSRFGLWLLFSIAIAVGSYLALAPHPGERR